MVREDRTEAGRGRRRAAWLGAGVALLAALGIGVLVGGDDAAARGWWGRHGHGPWGHHGGEVDPEALRDRTAFATAWILRRVEASEAQQDRVQSILDASVVDLLALRDAHREHRDALFELLASPEIDREALEALRAAEMALAEQASSRITAALADVADVLTLEQRLELLDMAHPPFGPPGP